MNVPSDLPKGIVPGRPYRPIYKRWWFWVAVLILAGLTWYLQGYFAWQGEQGKYDIQNAVSQSYWQYLQNQSAALEKQYREDTYGGATPEETLKLFVQALEQKDYALAAKYFVPEKVNDELARLPEAERSGGMAAFVNAYRSGQVVVTKYKDEEKYEIKLYEPSNNAPFLLQIIENPFTKKWLISDL